MFSCIYRRLFRVWHFVCVLFQEAPCSGAMTLIGAARRWLGQSCAALGARSEIFEIFLNDHCQDVSSWTGQLAQLTMNPATETILGVIC